MSNINIQNEFYCYDYTLSTIKKHASVSINSLSGTPEDSLHMKLQCQIMRLK